MDWGVTFSTLLITIDGWMPIRFRKGYVFVGSGLVAAKQNLAEMRFSCVDVGYDAYLVPF